MSKSPVSAFLKLKKQVNLAYCKNSNILIYTFIGSGCTHYLKTLANQDHRYTYINDINQKKGEYNLIDLTLAQTQEFIKSINTTQKYLAVISTGVEYHSATTKYLTSHTYIQHPLHASSRFEIVDMAKRQKSNTNSDFIDHVMMLSGGIPMLAKYLIVHNGIVNYQDKILLQLIEDIYNSTLGYSILELQKLGIIDSHEKYISTLLASTPGKQINININFDLTFSENGIKSTNKLNNIETKIIQKIIQNNGKISKSEVSDIKWGENKYDEFSDQAINKQIRRLSQKLSKYTIKTIPKVGFILETV